MSLKIYEKGENRFENFFFLKKKWNLKEPSKFIPINETIQYDKQINYEKQNEKNDIKTIIKNCNIKLIDKIVGSKRLKTEKSLNSNKNISFLPIIEKKKKLQINMKEINKKEKNLLYFNNYEESDSPKINLSKIVLKQIKLKNDYYKNHSQFVKRQKVLDNVNLTIEKHIEKQKKVKYKNLNEEMDIEKQKSMLIKYQKENAHQMKVENQYRIEILKGISYLIDSELTQQSQTVEGLIEAFQNDLKTQ